MKKHTFLSIISVYLAVFVGAALTSSCRKLIEIPPNPINQISSTAIFADSAGTMTVVAGVYNSFNVASSLGLNSGGITLATGLTGDELTLPTTGAATDVTMYNNATLTSDSKTLTLWTGGYATIYRINACLEGVAASSGLRQSFKDQLTGEMKVDRALCYFNMVRIFDAVPLVLTTNYEVNQSMPRTPVDTIYKQIIKDLTDAQKLLTKNYPSAGHARPNLYTANALLAKVYLHRGDWANAEAMATSVISSGIYTMNANLQNVFLDGSSEAIWQLPANGSGRQTAEAFTFVPTANNKVPTYYLAPYLLAAFETGDIRKQQWVGTNTVTGTNYYYPNKYKNRTTAAPIEDYMMVRLGELYLIRAEALAQQNKITDALNDLRIIRNLTRVGLAPYAGPTDQLSVIKAILHERQVELFCEAGNRWFDLRRTGTINSVLGQEKTTWINTAALFPIPIAQIQANPFLTQNPGYN